MDTASAGTTVSVAAELVTPEAVAVMFVLPAATAVARPEPLIVATPMLLDDQENVTPLIALPEESSAVAVNCSVAPTLTLALVGEIEMEATVEDPPPPLPLFEEDPPPQPANTMTIARTPARLRIETRAR